MKKFHWPLQRLLDVTTQRENALKVEVSGLVRRIKKLNDEKSYCLKAVRSLLDELAEKDLPQRMAEHEAFMHCCEDQYLKIERISRFVEEAENRRATKAAQLLRTRSSRQTLGRLRGEARQRYIYKQMKSEQQQMDEGAQIAFVRNKAIERMSA